MAAAFTVEFYRARLQIMAFTMLECPYSLCHLKWNNPCKQILFLPPIGVIFNSKGGWRSPATTAFEKADDAYM